MNDDRNLWRTSSYSEPNGGNCVEVAYTTETVGVRDSKNPRGGQLHITPDQWTRVLAWVR
ncbi:DUF397 domain-containing protein [Actinophytocola sp. NPDC049390]|uniref:DUF397 domain-containing protein n=1 Tax=Actinophytocola sp. NPDC049390 TaxID=3363894 RepID=UPI00379045EE